MNRKERRERAEQKKETIRKEIWKIMIAAEECKNLDPNTVVNKSIQIMKDRNPQESHFVKSICAEIRADVNKFCKTMVEKYGVK